MCVGHRMIVYTHTTHMKKRGGMLSTDGELLIKIKLQTEIEESTNMP